MIKCIIVDDERIILNELLELVRQCGVTVCGAYQNPKQALEEIDDTNPDAAFLDIEMPELNGIELAKKLREKNIKIVFITAYKEHAILAFGVNAIHYLLKPVQKDDIKEAVLRIHEEKLLKTGLGSLNSATFLKNGAGVPDRISMKKNNHIQIIMVADVLYISSQSGLTTITTKSGSYKSRKGMQFWEDSLKKAGFLRCHKSYLVNTLYISKMIHSLGEYKELELKYGDICIPISRRKVSKVKSWLGTI